MEETSLEDFLEEAESGDEPPDGDRTDRTAEPPAETADAAGDGGAEAIEPVVATSAWTPQGGECEYCGATVERRWRDGDALACVDCVDW